MKKILFLLVIVILLVMPSFVAAQTAIGNPQLPFTAWNSVRNFVLRTAEQAIVVQSDSFSYNVTTLTRDSLYVFTPRSAMEITSANLWFESIDTPDSTLYLVIKQPSLTDTLLTIDSTGNGNTIYWTSTNSVILTPAVACSVFIYNGAASSAHGRTILTLFGINK